MWGSWTIGLLVVLGVGALVLSFAFVGPLLFGLAVALLIGAGLLIAAGMRRAAAASEGAGGGFMQPPSDRARFGEGAKDRGSDSVPLREDPR